MINNSSLINVLVAIVTYNGEQYLEKCLNSIESEKYNIDVFIIDNNSNVATKKLLEKFKKKLKIIFLNENLGFGQANNLMLKYGIENDYDYVFLLNQDTYFIKDSLDKIIFFAQKNDSKAIVSPIHLAPNESKMDSSFKKYYQKGSLVESLYQCSFINAAAWLIPIELIKKIGGFSPLFFHYGEDRDLANRLIYYGGRFLVFKEASIVHDRKKRTISDLIDLDCGKYAKRSEINLLRYAADINNNFFIAYCNVVYKGGGEIKKQIVNWNWKLVFMHLSNIGKIFFKYKKIFSHRKEASKKGAFL